MSSLSGNKKKWIRLLGTVLFVAILLLQVDLGEVLAAFREFSPLLYLWVFVLFLFGMFISSIRWKILLASQDIHVGLGRVFRFYLLGYIWNFTLPSSMGGDIVKIYKIIGEDTGKQKATGATLATVMDRVLGLFAMVLLIGLSVSANIYLPPWSRVTLSIGCAVFLLSMLLLISGKLPWVSQALLRLAGLFSLRPKVEKILSAMRLFGQRPGWLLLAFVISVVFQLLGVFNQWLAFKVVAVDVPIAPLFFAVLLTRMLTALPISIGGVGLKEVGMLGLLAAVGISSSQIISYSLVSYSQILLLISAYGVTMILPKLTRRGRRDQSVSPSAGSSRL